MTRTAATQEAILTAAIDLFNKSGTAAISTNHIAAAAGISPGNLYYHFKNKEHIIRAILEQMTGAWDEVYVLPEDAAFTAETLREILRRNFELVWRYRFFYRELVALLRHDRELAKRYRAIRQRRQAQQLQWFQQLTVSGALRQPVSSVEAESLLTIGWLVSDYWLAFLESGGESVNADQIQQGVDLIMRVYAPYFNA